MGNTCKNQLPGNNQFQFAHKKYEESQSDRSIPTQSKGPGKQISSFPTLSQEQQNQLQQLGPISFDEQREKDSAKKISLGKVYLLKNGEKYKGEEHDGKIWGQGKFYTLDKSYLHCYTIDNKPIGKVRLVKINGDFYEGETHNFQADGQGTLSQNGVLYTGEFMNNQFDGKGVQKAEHYTFEGTYKVGQKVRGKLVWNIGKPNQSTFIGSFHNDMFEGRGILQNSKGSYEGLFKNGQKQGFGIFTWKNSARFEGKYKKDRKNGEGKMYNPKGDFLFEGLWENDNLIIPQDSKK